uniref:Uncharacterized protein LOC101242320 n=1 Tax=Phallusia mammillata TaxID=59560 RepID=A0A6F9DHZ1_9ASCI|nr:uncharacterized protein LOC101242320 [Phallusia mammillata]
MESDWSIGHTTSMPSQSDNAIDSSETPQMHSPVTVSHNLEERFQLESQLEQRQFVHTDSQSIGSKGGTLTAGGCQVKIPENACDEEVKIVITSCYGYGNSKISVANRMDDFMGWLTPMLKCEPEGFEFKKPIEITLPTCYRNVEEPPVSVTIRHKTNESDWEVLTQCLMDQMTHSFTFPTEHFSEFGIFTTFQTFIGLIKETAIILTLPSYANELVSKIVINVYICDNMESTKDVKGCNILHTNITKRRNKDCDVQIKVFAEHTKAKPDQRHFTLNAGNVKNSWPFLITRTDGKNWNDGENMVTFKILSKDPGLDCETDVFLLKSYFNKCDGDKQNMDLNARDVHLGDVHHHHHLEQSHHGDNITMEKTKNTGTVGSGTTIIGTIDQSRREGDFNMQNAHFAGGNNFGAGTFNVDTGANKSRNVQKIDMKDAQISDCSIFGLGCHVSIPKDQTASPKQPPARDRQSARTSSRPSATSEKPPKRKSCKCNKCGQTETDGVCCKKDVKALQKMQTSSLECIMDHPGFYLCLDPYALEKTYKRNKRAGLITTEGLSQAEKYKLAAKHEYLEFVKDDDDDDDVVPSCVQKAIDEKLHGEDRTLPELK